MPEPGPNGVASSEVLFRAEDWLAVARQCPPLAQVLLRATLGQNVPGPLDAVCWHERWHERFLQAPPWDRVISLLEGGLFPPAHPAAFALAEVTRSVAHHTRWCSPEAAFWFALCQAPGTDPCPKRGGDEGPQVLALDGLSRSLQAAGVLLRLGNPHGGLITATLQEESILLEQEYPDVSWQDLLMEAKEASCRQPRALDGNLGRELLLAARLARSRFEADRSAALLDILGAKDLGELAQRLAQATAGLAAGSIAVWVDDPASDEGVGVVIDEGTVHDPFRCTQRQFETARLSPLARESIPLRNPRGHTIGRVYFTEWCSNPTERWAREFSRTAAAVWDRLRLEREVERLREAMSTRQRQLHRELSFRHQSAIAEFGAGAAHHIHNPLATIAGQAEWLLRDEVDPARRQALGKIGRQVSRVHRMIRDVHAVGSSVLLPKSRVLLSEVVDQAVAAAARRCSAAQLTLHGDTQGISLHGHVDQLIRMVEEIIVNGLEAAGRQGAVEVRVEVADVVEPAVPTNGTGPAPAGRHDHSALAAVRVIDSGPGMTAQDRRHAFDPFYAGRSAGRGLGMGLPLARRIAEQHGGWIVLPWTRPTTVTIFLPISPPPPSRSTGPDMGARYGLPVE